MNYADLLGLAEHAMYKADPTDAYRWVIAIQDRTLVCIPRNQLTSAHTHIFGLSRFQLRQGLSPVLWTELQAALIEHRKEIQQWQEPPEPLPLPTSTPSSIPSSPNKVQDGNSKEG